MTDVKRPCPTERGALGQVGRARLWSCFLDADVPAEMWCFESSDAGIARRLASMGSVGVGGFSAGWGQDEHGAFALRRLPSKTVEDLARGERLDGLTALSKLRDLARALEACERRSIFVGPLRPAEIALGSHGRAEAFLLAESWVRALAGAEPAPSGASSRISPRWTPPEQWRGDPWNNAANRYVLGLVAYRVIAGVHPFGGGMRDVMAASDVAPPPFDESIARSLKPGIQSFILAMLDPDASKRPPSAEAIAQRCEEWMRDAPLAPPARRADLTSTAATSRVRGERSEARPSNATPPRSRWRRLGRASVPIVLGASVAAIAFASSATSREASTTPSDVKSLLSQRPLQGTSPEACAGCHARQVSEWKRSVMAHAVKSPLFGALESVVQEQVGRDSSCRNGAGVLRRASEDACRDATTGLVTTGAGGEHWCVNCHAAADNLGSTVPAWSATANGASRRPLRDLLSSDAMDGISCAVCHQTIGPTHASAAYQGNVTWTSPATGAVFRTRPEENVGLRGIGNSGYLLDPSVFRASSLGSGGKSDPIVHRRAPDEAARYLRSSEFCGSCHDVRLFGTDAIGVHQRGEHFKRLRNAYSEWRSWADAETAAGRTPASCQDCHMSLYPGVCVANAPEPARQGSGAFAQTAPALDDEGCPPGFRFEPRRAGERPRARVAVSSSEVRATSSHWFTSVDLPLSPEFPDAWIDEGTLDPSGVPLGLEARRRQLLRRTFELTIDEASRVGSKLEVPIELRNVGAGHRVPAGFSQEREIWIELVVRDGRGAVVYEVGKLDSEQSNLRDKIFVIVTTRDDVKDARGRPLGVFGADVVDGPDVPRWTPVTIEPSRRGARVAKAPLHAAFKGRGLVNLQNGFLRCVRCIGIVDAEGRCQPGPGQGRTRADRYDDGAYDIDTGECRSNLSGANAFFETYFPVGALDAERGVLKAPDAILDERSAPPGAALRYTYEIDVSGRRGPFSAQVRLRFRPFPPFLIRAFADYEARKASEGLRPSGPQVTSAMLARNHPIDLADASVTID